MTPGSVYYVTWVETRGGKRGLSSAHLRFIAEHPSGKCLFRYADGFMTVDVNRSDIVEWDEAEANR